MGGGLWEMVCMIDIVKSLKLFCLETVLAALLLSSCSQQEAGTPTSPSALSAAPVAFATDENATLPGRITLTLTSESLIRQALDQIEEPDNRDVEQIYVGSFGRQFMYRCFFTGELSSYEQVCSCLEINGTFYDLMLYENSSYDACQIGETLIDAPQTIYAFNIVLGANYAQRQYLCIEDGIPYIIAQIDCASEVDLDGDHKEETVYLHGTPMQAILYLWDFESGTISHVDINAALGDTVECLSVHDVRTDSGVFFVASWFDVEEQVSYEARYIIRKEEDGSVVMLRQ